MQAGRKPGGSIDAIDRSPEQSGVRRRACVYGVIIPADDEARLNEGSVASWRRQNAAIRRGRRQYRLPVTAAVVHPHPGRAA